MRRWLSVLTVILIGSVRGVLADGKVFARPEAQVKVEIPSQQALIYHNGRRECLVIETAFLGEGTNFAWVVPLPSEPKVQAVATSFFPALRQAFQPRLLHRVHHYYIGVLFVCGLAFLAWRSLKDEVAWVVDLPLCLLMAAGVGWLTKSAIFGVITIVFTIGTRLFIRSTTSLTLVILVAMLLAFWITVAFHLEELGLVQTMGGDGGPATEASDGVTLVSVQRAGLYETATIRSANARAIMEWLVGNGFAAPKSIEPVVDDYVARGWVFVASKVRRAEMTGGVTSLHPLAFTFATATPVYPLKLTGVDNGDCSIDLYVFGERRAAAPHFRVARCDRVANHLPDNSAKRWNSWLQIQDVEVLKCISNATVGTKLSARLHSRQMSSDAEITWRWFRSKGGVVYSYAGAVVLALNVGVPLAVLGWFLVGASWGGWGVDEEFIARWRRRAIVAAMVVGCAIFWLLPKVEIITH